jgi:hypothetical protein
MVGTSKPGHWQGRLASCGSEKRLLFSLTRVSTRRSTSTRTMERGDPLRKLSALRLAIRIKESVGRIGIRVRCLAIANVESMLNPVQRSSWKSTPWGKKQTAEHARRAEESGRGRGEWHTKSWKAYRGGGLLSTCHSRLGKLSRLETTGTRLDLYAEWEASIAKGLGPRKDERRLVETVRSNTL